MTHKEFRQLCETAEHDPREPEPDPAQLQALVDAVDEMLKLRNRAKSTFN
jgi:hypothetical protein